MYNIQFLDEAIDELSQLDKPVVKRIIKKIKWLSENIDNIQPEGLSGSLAGLYKLRVGSYRVIYQILEAERLIIIHAVGHRSKIYKR